MKTLAAVLVAQRQPLELMEVELPSLSYGQVLVQLSASRICGSQLGEIDGVKGPDRWLPHLLGHEGAGTVLEVGPEVRRVKPGDKVCLHWRPAAGIEARPPVYASSAGSIHAGFLTTFNHHAVVSENRLTPVPPGTDDEVLCLLADTLTTGFGVIENDASVKIGESVVVVGAGGIGLGAILGASLTGAFPVVAVDRYEAKLEVARRFGATHTVNSASSGGFLAEVERLIGGKADVVVDGTGNPEVIAEAFALTAAKGRTLLFGVMPQGRQLSLNTLPLHFGKVLKGSEGGGSHPDRDIPRYLRLMEAGRFNPSGMVSHRGSLEAVNSLISAMRAGEVIHAVMHYPS
jgi:S-(hydroxymethyl)glutathione dehydrogenase/alcohol dehydrogenase